MEERRRPITEAQLWLISYWTRKAAEKTLRHYIRRAVVAWAALVVGIGVVFAVQQRDNVDSRDAVVQSGRVVAVDGCNRDFETIKSVRGILIDARAQLIKQHKRGLFRAEQETQYREAIDFYKKRLATLPLPDCRVADKILTAEPGKLPPPPNPLYQVEPKHP